MGLVGACQRHSRTPSEVDQWLSEQERPKVLSTVGMIDDLVRQIGGETIARLTLISPALDPHRYELVKGDDEKLAGADLIFFNGLGLEHGASLARYLHDNPKAVAVGEGIVAADASGLVSLDGQVDPHIWTDVSLWRMGADVIAQRLKEISPQHGEQYDANCNALKERLAAVHTGVQQEMERVPLERRYLVTCHDAFHYFARRYLATDEERANGGWRERCTAPEGISPEGQLSSLDIQYVIDHLSRHRVHVLFAESNLNQDSIRKIVDAGGRLGLSVRIAKEPLFADAMGPAGSPTDTYERMMLYNARVIADNLSEES